MIGWGGEGYISYYIAFEWRSPCAGRVLLLGRQPVDAQLRRKYDTQFNFFYTREPNEVIYNHTTVPATIHFKDAVIYADYNEYLKRYYFLTNALGKEEIYDRVRLLAGQSALT